MTIVRRSRRRVALTRFGLCALVGIVSSYAVAWSCVLWWPNGFRAAHDTTSSIPFRVPDGWSRPEGVELRYGWGVSSILWNTYQLEEARKAQLAREEWERNNPGVVEIGGRRNPIWWQSGMFEFQAGWPWRVVRGSGSRPTFDVNEPWHEPTWDVIVVTHQPGSLHRSRLPLRPTFPGIVWCTALYGAIMYLLLFAPFDVRRLRRARRCRCVRCGYDLSGSTESARCPECGEATALVR